jgi:hypothetical protein
MVKHEVSLSSVVEQLREIDRESGWTRTLRIGELLLRVFFKGETSAWHDRRKNKDYSIRRLAACPDCPLRKSALAEAVNVYILYQEFPYIRDLEAIGPSHAAAVLGLEQEKQVELIQTASQHRLGVRELRGRATALRRIGGERRGRPAIPAARKSLTRLRHAGDELDAAEAMLLHAKSVDGETAGRVSEEVDRLGQLVRRIRQNLFNRALVSPAELQTRPSNWVASTPQLDLVASG